MERIVLPGYRDGQLFDFDAVILSEGNRSFYAEEFAAQAFAAMREAAQRSGVNILITNFFRDNAHQARLYASFQRRLKEWELMPPSERGARPPGASKPGWSKHQSGVAVDIRMSSEVERWLNQFAADYGFFRTVSNEPWHFEYIPERIKEEITKP